MPVLEQNLDLAINEFEGIVAFVSENATTLQLIPPETQSFLQLTSHVETLRTLKRMLELRDVSFQVLQSYTEVEEKIEVEFNGINIPFSIARIFSLQAYLSCLWSIYDQLAGFGRIFLHRNSGLENCNLKKMFINTGDRNTKVAMEMLSETLTNSFGFEIDLCYGIRNLFLHTSGLERTNAFVDSKTGSSAFEITANFLNSMTNDVSPNILEKARRANHPGLSNSDLLELLRNCESSIDKACVFILRSSTSVLKDVTHCLAI
jgi:hypothetical protein